MELRGIAGRLEVSRSANIWNLYVNYCCLRLSLAKQPNFDNKANLNFGDPYLLQQAIKTQTKYIFRISTARRRAQCILGLHWLKLLNILRLLAYKAAHIKCRIPGIISKYSILHLDIIILLTRPWPVQQQLVAITHQITY